MDDVLFATKRTVDGKKDDYLIQLFSKRGKFDRGVGWEILVKLHQMVWHSSASAQECSS